MRRKLLPSGLVFGLVASVGSGAAYASATAIDIKLSSEHRSESLQLAQMGNTNTGVNFDPAAPGVGGYGRHRGPSDPNPKRPPGGAASLDKPAGQNPQAAQSDSGPEKQSTPTFTPSR
jgi:hypothetical protein